MLDHAFRSLTFRDATVYGRRLASIREFAVMAGAALLLAAVPAHAQDAHGVIAFGETGDNAVAYGVSWNRDTRDRAREAAVEACVARVERTAPSSPGSGTAAAPWRWINTARLRERAECRGNRRKRAH